MNRKSFLYSLFVIVLGLNACEKEGELQPSGLDQHWFVIPDKPGELNQLLYRIYQDTGMPIFVNDTLGEEYFATDAAGNRIHRVETFNISQMLFGAPDDSTKNSNRNVSIVQSSDTSAMMRVANLIKDKVLPGLPKRGTFTPKCLFLVDSCKFIYKIMTGFNPRIYPDNNLHAYKALKGIVVGRLSDVMEMSPDELDHFAGKILASQVVNWVTSVVPQEDTDAWYAITDEGAVGKSYYQTYYMKLTGTKPNPLYEQNMMQTAGMFGWYAENVSPLDKNCERATYPQVKDLEEYIAYVYAYKGKEAEFTRKYGMYDKMVRKFNQVKEFVRAYERAFGLN